MIWAIPSSKEEINVITPLGAKSIRYLYFENKNSGIFNFKNIPDCIDISIDGKQICKNLIMLPFLTGTSEGTRRFLWEEIAIKVPMNIDNSVVKISGVRNNDFNIVFVLSEKAVEEQAGFDFYESRVIDFKRLKTKDTKGNDIIRYFADEFRASMPTNNIKTINDNNPTYTDRDIVLTLDHEPTGFFAYNILLDTDIVTTDFPKRVGKLTFQPHFTITMQAGDNETVPTNFDLALASCTNNIPHSKALYMFGEKTNKTVAVHIDPIVRSVIESDNDQQYVLQDVTQDGLIVNFQTILFFKSKQIA